MWENTTLLANILDIITVPGNFASLPCSSLFSSWWMVLATAENRWNTAKIRVWSSYTMWDLSSMAVCRYQHWRRRYQLTEQAYHYELYFMALFGYWPEKFTLMFIFFQIWRTILRQEEIDKNLIECVQFFERSPFGWIRILLIRLLKKKLRLHPIKNLIEINLLEETDNSDSYSTSSCPELVSLSRVIMRLFLITSKWLNLDSMCA